MNSVKVIKVSSIEFDKLIIARHIIGLIKILGLREIILEILHKE